MFAADAARSATLKVAPFHTRVEYIINVLFRTSIMHACAHNQREARIIVRQNDYTLSRRDPAFWHTVQQADRMSGDVLDTMRKLGYDACVYHHWAQGETVPTGFTFVIKW